MKRILGVLSHAVTALVVLGICGLAVAAPAQQVIILNSGAAVSVSNPLSVTGTFTPSGTQTVVGGSTAADDGALTAALKTWSILAGFDGTTADLIRSGDVNNIAAATGYLDVLAIGRYNATLPTLTDTRFNALQVDSRGTLETTPYYSGTPAAVGSGAMTAGVPRIALATDSPGIITTGSPGSASSTVISLQGVAGMTPVLASLTGALAITPETATSGIVSNAAAVATLATAVGKTTYITGFQCTPGSATAAAVISIVVSGTITGSMTYSTYVTNGTTFVPAPVPVVVSFVPAIPASATNTTIVVTMGAVGTGGASAVCNAQGYQQ